MMSRHTESYFFERKLDDVAFDVRNPQIGTDDQQLLENDDDDAILLGMGYKQVSGLKSTKYFLFLLHGRSFTVDSLAS